MSYFFVVEYGRRFRINVAANATLDQKAAAAVKQMGRFSALQIQNGQQVGYELFGTQGGTPDEGYYNDANRKTLAPHEAEATDVLVELAPDGSEL